MPESLIVVPVGTKRQSLKEDLTRHMAAEDAAYVRDRLSAFRYNELGSLPDLGNKVLLRTGGEALTAATLGLGVIRAKHGLQDNRTYKGFQRGLEALRLKKPPEPPTALDILGEELTRQSLPSNLSDYARWAPRTAKRVFLKNFEPKVFIPLTAVPFAGLYAYNKLRDPQQGERELAHSAAKVLLRARYDEHQDKQLYKDDLRSLEEQVRDVRSAQRLGLKDSIMRLRNKAPLTRSDTVLHV
jgi:hypothetical protein